MRSTQLTSRKPTKIYSEKDFKEATTSLERIYMYMMQPQTFHLNDSDYEKLRKLEHVWTICFNELSPVQATRKVVELYGISSASARNLIKNAEELFAPLFKRSGDMANVVLLEQLNLVYKKAIVAEDYKSAVRALAEINKLREKEDNLSKLLDMLQMPTVIFTDNPDVLEIEHEEVDE